jgi:hypothetical protein
MNLVRQLRAAASVRSMDSTVEARSADLTDRLVEVAAGALFVRRSLEDPNAYSPAGFVALAGGLTARVVEVRGEESSADMLELLDADGNVVVMVGDTALDQMAGDLPVPTDVLFRLLAARTCDDTGNPFVAPPPPTLTATRPEERLHEAARYYVDRLSTRDVPGTCRGNLACAWAVNFIANVSLGEPVGGGRSTQRMRDVLRAGGTRWRLVESNTPQPGDLILSPTSDKATGHVGIVGADGLVYSNSSSRASWRQNYSFDSWRDRYQRLGLEMLLFRWLS